MPLKASSNSGSESRIDPIPADMHHAVCYAVYDLGHHYSEKFDKWSHDCLVIWEIPELRIELEKDGQKQDLPRAISKKYTLSLGEKANLRKDLVAWRGRPFTEEELNGFDLKNILGKSCNLQVIHNHGKGANAGKVYANINGIIPKMKGQPDLRPENPIVYFSIDDHGAGNPPPQGTPKWVADIIMDSREYKKVLQPEDSIEESVPGWGDAADSGESSPFEGGDDHEEEPPF